MNVWLPERYQHVSQRRFTGADAMALRRRRDGAAAGEHVVMQSGPSQSMPVSGSAVVAVAEKTARTRPAEPEDGPPGPEVYVVPAGTVYHRRRTCGKLRCAHRIIATAGCPRALLGCNRGRWRPAARGTTTLHMTAS